MYINDPSFTVSCYLNTSGVRMLPCFLCLLVMTGHEYAVYSFHGKKTSHERKQISLTHMLTLALALLMASSGACDLISAVVVQHTCLHISDCYECIQEYSFTFGHCQSEALKMHKRKSLGVILLVFNLDSAMV